MANNTQSGDTSRSVPSGFERLWGVPELAENLGVPVQTVYRWIHRNDGPPSIKVGRHRKFRPEAVRRWLDSLAEGERWT